MNKQDWLDIKKNKQYNIDSLFEFWNTIKKPNYKDLTIDEFAELIQVYANNGGQLSDEKLEEYFDKKFNIIKLYDNKGKLIKEL